MGNKTTIPQRPKYAHLMKVFTTDYYSIFYR